MYEKLMYKVTSQDNKVIYRLQDFTKNDNVNEDKFVEGRNTKGAKRLQCQVMVLHMDEFDALNDEVETLRDKIMKKNVEIKRLRDEVGKLKRSNIDKDKEIRKGNSDILVAHEKAVSELNEKHANELLAIDRTHRKEIENIYNDFNKRLDVANERVIATVQVNEDIQSKLRRELSELQQSHFDEVGVLKNEFDEMRAKFLKLLASEHARDMSDFNDCGDLPFYVRPFARGFIEKFNEFKERKQLRTPQVIVEFYELGEGEGD